jgi:threonine synthase
MLSNTRADIPTFVSHLECSLTGQRYSADCVHNLSDQGKPLLVRYDLKALGRALNKSDLLTREPGMWRYREFLPIRRAQDIVSLGEVITPLIDLPRTQARIGAKELVVKDESRLPTGSFKARGMAVAVSMAKALGIQQIALPSAGNAGVALAAYCARAGIKSFVFYTEDAPAATVSEIALFGAHGYAVNGVITDLGPIVQRGSDTLGWFNASTLKEPYRVEGKKTMGLELAEQLNWELPDVIVYPTGGGTGIIGMWKAFAELEAIGWIGSKRPRMVVVQSQNCAPLVRAFDEGTVFAEPWRDPSSIIQGVRVPATVGDFIILRLLRESGGFAIAIDDQEAEPVRREVAASDGIHLSLEGAATIIACRQAIAEGRVKKTERIVAFNCAGGFKYPLEYVPRRLNRHSAIDFASL